MTDSQSPASPEALFHAALQAVRVVSEMIADARQALGDGQLVALTQMEPYTRAACEAAQRLPPPYNHRLRSDLEAILYDLDALEQDMASQFGEQMHREQETIHAPTVGAAYQAGLKRARTLAAPPPSPPERK